MSYRGRAGRGKPIRATRGSPMGTQRVYFPSKQQQKKGMIRRIYNDASEAWGVGFQDAGTSTMNGIIELYNNVMYYSVIILVSVLWMLVSAILERRSVLYKGYVGIMGKREKGMDGGVKIGEDKSSIVEVIWTVTPAFILIGIALPSFKLLYLVDEVVDPSITLKAIGFLTGGLKSDRL